MKIDLTNYETFLIDYLDGKLSAAEVEEVLLFLENHPGIKEEFAGMNEIVFQTEIDTFDSSFLHKPQFEAIKIHYEPLLVAQLEGDLGIGDQLTLQQGLNLYPELRGEVQLFAQTKLTPEQSLVFPNKHQLYKGNVFIQYRQTILRIAAILLVTSFVGLYWFQLNKNISHPIAQTSIPESVSTPQPNQNDAIIPAPKYSQTQEPVSVALTKLHPTIQTKQPASIVVIDPIQNASIENPTPPETASLTKSKFWLNYPAEHTNDHYVSLSDFLRGKLAIETKQLEQKTKRTLQEMNKTAGVSIQKNSSGRITHFEIEALGFAWSQTK